MSLNKKRLLRFSLQTAVIALLIIVDRIIKNAVDDHIPVTLHAGEEVYAWKLDGFIGITHYHNTGASFSMLAGHTTALSVVTAIALIAAMIILFLLKEKPMIYHICIPLIIAGGAGNLLDRLTRGYVIDYIQTLFVEFPVFNFADCLLTCACFSLIIYLIYDIYRDHQKAKEQIASAEAAENAAAEEDISDD